MADFSYFDLSAEAALAIMAEAGLTGAVVTVDEAGVHATADQGDAAVHAALDDYPSRIPPLPDWFAPHVQHLKDFRDAVRAGTDGTITAAQTRHVLADTIDAFRILNRRMA